MNWYGGKHSKLFSSVGMSVGETLYSLYNSIFIARHGVFYGTNLPSLLQEINYFLELSKRFENKVSRVYLNIYAEMIEALMGNDTSSNAPTDRGNPGDENTISQSEAYMKNIYISRIIQSFYSGHVQRCSHYVEKMLGMKPLGTQNRIFVSCCCSSSRMNDLSLSQQ